VIYSALISITLSNFSLFSGSSFNFSGFKSGSLLNNYQLNLTINRASLDNSQLRFLGYFSGGNNTIFIPSIIMDSSNLTFNGLTIFSLVYNTTPVTSPFVIDLGPNDNVYVPNTLTSSNVVMNLSSATYVFDGFPNGNNAGISVYFNSNTITQTQYTLNLTVGSSTNPPASSNLYHYQVKFCSFINCDVSHVLSLRTVDEYTSNNTPIYFSSYRNSFINSEFKVNPSGTYNLLLSSNVGSLLRVLDSNFNNSKLYLQGTGTGSTMGDFTNTIQFSSFNQSTFTVNPSSVPSSNRVFLVDKSAFFNSITGLSAAPTVNFSVVNCNFSGFNSTFGAGTQRTGTSAVTIYNAEIVNNQASFNFNYQDLVSQEYFYNFLTGKYSIAVMRRLQRNLKEAGLNITSEQWSIMYNLWVEEGLTQQELAVRTFRDKPSVTRLINNLERVNLVIRVNDKNDRRSNLIYLTKIGRKMKDEGMKQAKNTIEQALGGLADDQIALSNTILHRVLFNLK
jgi:DNA-binding MarR family transcriptional regulator